MEISSLPSTERSLRCTSVAEMAAACLRIRSTGRNAPASASHTPPEIRKSAAEPAIASVHPRARS
jgi:hypothetical protein